MIKWYYSGIAGGTKTKALQSRIGANKIVFLTKWFSFQEVVSAGLVKYNSLIADILFYSYIGDEGTLGYARGKTETTVTNMLYTSLR